MAMMATAAHTMILGTRQDQLEIRAGAEGTWNGREKARPTGATLVFHRGSEQRQITADARKYARPLVVILRA